MTKEYTGGSVSYYRVKITHPTALPAPYEAECNDIIEALKMTFAEGNAFKAIWRKCAARSLGLSKQGYSDGLYDAEKVEFFGRRMVVQEQASRGEMGDVESPVNAQTPQPDLVFSPPPPTPVNQPGTPAKLADDSLKPTDPWELVGTPRTVEPAAEIDDESDRQKAVEQNGNDGAVYEDPWYGAPDWAKYKAQDEDGEWRWYSHEPEAGEERWHDIAFDGRAAHAGESNPNPNWRDTLISR